METETLGHKAKRAGGRALGFASDMLAHGAHKRLARQAPSGIDISIVIPAHNAMPELTQALHSLISQTYAHSRMEVIVADDCSTDGTAEEVERFSELEPGMFKIVRLEHASGSPAAPRNRGLECACGTYVFFLDADDWLDNRAVAHMLDHAVAWESDILLVKMVGEAGRDVPTSMFGRSKRRVDVFGSKVMRTFAPLKLFRRSLIANERFPAYMPEDIPFVLRAYCAAGVVSVAADIDYYHATMSDRRGHASITTWNDAESNLKAYRDILDVIDTAVPAEKRDMVLMPRLFERDFYRTLCTILHDCEQNTVGAKENLQQFCGLVGPYYNTQIAACLPAEARTLFEQHLLGKNEDIV